MGQKCYERNEPCSGKFYIYRGANGGKCARAWCERCLMQPPSKAMKGFAPLREFTADEVDRMGEYADVATTQALGHKACARCGVVGPTESHHWAPRHLFGAEADSWPVSELCGPCHKRWHEVMTPKMSSRKGLWRTEFEGSPSGSGGGGK